MGRIQVMILLLRSLGLIEVLAPLKEATLLASKNGESLMVNIIVGLRDCLNFVNRAHATHCSALQILH